MLQIALKAKHTSSGNTGFDLASIQPFRDRSKIFSKTETRDLVLSLPTRALTARIYYHKATANGNARIGIHHMIVGKAKILEIVDTATIANTVHPLSTKPNTGFMVSRKPFLLEITPEGNRPQFLGQSLKAFKMNIKGKINTEYRAKVQIPSKLWNTTTEFIEHYELVHTH